MSDVIKTDEVLTSMEMPENRVNQGIEAVQEEAYKSGSVQYIDSREVAEMVGKNHKDLMRDVRRYCSQMEEINRSNSGSIDSNQRNLALDDFFLESSYHDAKGEKRPCYLVTKKGCEFIAHKLTGLKGTKFTATYINRFHEMEGALANRNYDELMPVIQKFMEEQAEFNKMILDRLERALSRRNGDMEEAADYTIDGGDKFAERRRTLNQLVGRMAKACGWDNNFALHRMYRTLEDVLHISLDEFLNVCRVETMNKNASTLEAVIRFDKLYEVSVMLMTNTINKMQCM